MIYQLYFLYSIIIEYKYLSSFDKIQSMDKKTLCKIVGNNIKRIRLARGYTQETFAEHMHVSWSYVSKLECGVLNLSLGKILQISQYLDVDVQELLTICE